VTAAATAFAAGQQAELGRQWERAAEFYELADHISPTPEALRSAARNHLSAGDKALAATQAEELLRRYPNDSRSVALASGILQQTTSKLAFWEIRCHPACTIAVDSIAITTEPRDEHVIYVDPGEREIGAFFSGNRVSSRTVVCEQGGRQQLSFEPPPEPETQVPTAKVPAVATEHPISESSGLSPTLAIAGMTLTAALGGFTIWSGLDTLSAHDDFLNTRTRAAYNDGIDRERRTNVLIGATAVIGVATLAVALFATHWSTPRSPAGAAPQTLRIDLAATSSEGRFAVRGSF
jgi:hypothetical protein